MRSGDAVVEQDALPGQWLCKKNLDFIFRALEALFWNQGKQAVLPKDPAKTAIFARYLSKNSFDNSYHLEVEAGADERKAPQIRMESGQIAAKITKNHKRQFLGHQKWDPRTSKWLRTL